MGPGDTGLWVCCYSGALKAPGLRPGARRKRRARPRPSLGPAPGRVHQTPPLPAGPAPCARGGALWACPAAPPPGGVCRARGRRERRRAERRERGSAAGRAADPGPAAAVPWAGTVLPSGGGQSGGRRPARPSPSRPAPVWGGCAVGRRRRRRGLRPAEMDLAGTIILLCSCAAGAGGEEPPGLAGPCFGAVSLPPSLFLLSVSPVSGARGRGRRAPLSGAQGRGWAARRAPRSAAASARPGLSPPPGAGLAPPPLPRDFPGEDRVSCSRSPSPSGPARPCLFSPPGPAAAPRDFPPGPAGRCPAPSLAPAAASLSRHQEGRAGGKFSLRKYKTSSGSPAAWPWLQEGLPSPRPGRTPLCSRGRVTVPAPVRSGFSALGTGHFPHRAQ